MTNRPEDLSNDELRALSDDLLDRIDVLDNEGNGAPEDLLNEWAQAHAELNRRDALEARKAGRYSVTFDVDGEAHEYELKATTQDEAEAEAMSGAEAMSTIGGRAVTVQSINGPIV